eukprot:scaffold1728_cov258-Pinguiococcus_pyrenoidosus.AAC.2
MELPPIRSKIWREGTTLAGVQRAGDARTNLGKHAKLQDHPPMRESACYESKVVIMTQAARVGYRDAARHHRLFSRFPSTEIFSLRLCGRGFPSLGLKNALDTGARRGGVHQSLHRLPRPIEDGVIGTVDSPIGRSVVAPIQEE